MKLIHNKIYIYNIIFHKLGINVYVFWSIIRYTYMCDTFAIDDIFFYVKNSISRFHLLLPNHIFYSKLFVYDTFSNINIFCFKVYILFDK